MLFRSNKLNGASWTYVGNALSGNGPFINRASTSYQNLDVLYTVSSAGVDKSSDFGISWNPTSIGGTWGNSFWSGADVEVSLANPRYVYAGGVMSNNADIFVSKDCGCNICLSKKILVNICANIWFGIFQQEYLVWNI